MNSQKIEDIESAPEVITIPTDSCVVEEPIATEQSRPLTAKSTTSSGKSAENLSRKARVSI